MTSNIASKQAKQNLLTKQGKINSSIIVMGNVSTVLSKTAGDTVEEVTEDAGDSNGTNSGSGPRHS